MFLTELNLLIYQFALMFWICDADGSGKILVLAKSQTSTNQISNH